MFLISMFWQAIRSTLAFERYLGNKVAAGSLGRDGLGAVRMRHQPVRAEEAGWFAAIAAPHAIGRFGDEQRAARVSSPTAAAARNADRQVRAGVYLAPQEMLEQCRQNVGFTERCRGFQETRGDEREGQRLRSQRQHHMCQAETH